MHAAILRKTGDTDLDIVDDCELRAMGPGDVKVRITHSGVCHSDLSAMNGTIPQPPPAVLGHEGAGIVEEVGEGVTTVAPGDHVIIAWSPPCGSCKYCVDFKQPNLCLNMMFVMGGNPQFRHRGDTIGAMAGAGTFAEYTIVPQQASIKIDNDIPLEVAALIGCGVMTGAGAAINTAKVRPGSSVIVFGAGGVGISAIQGARIAGAAEILAVDVNVSKLEEAKAFGATHACTPEQVNDLKVQITGGDGLRLLARMHRQARDHAGGLRRDHGGAARAASSVSGAWRRWSTSRPSSCSSTRRRSSARTTAAPTCGSTSTGCCASTVRASSTSIA